MVSTNGKGKDLTTGGKMKEVEENKPEKTVTEKEKIREDTEITSLNANKARARRSKHQKEKTMNRRNADIKKTSQREKRPRWTDTTVSIKR